MQQTRYRTALGGRPVRPRRGRLRGINSCTQQTSTLLSRFSAPGVNVARPLSGVNSRTQQTSTLLSQYSTPGVNVAQPSPAMSSAARAGMQGLGSAAISHGLGALGAHWMLQALATAAGAEFIGKAMQERDATEELEKMASAREHARKLSDPFLGADRAGPTHVVVADMRERPYSPRVGLGQTGAAAAGASAATTISSAAISSGSSIASSSTWLAAAGGPIGLAVAGVTTGLSYLFSRKRPQRKVATTQIVNEVEPLLQQNLEGYLNGPRTVSSQAQAVANFDAGWQFVVDNCGIPNMGKPGQWCIQDRDRGGQFDWFRRYRDPIQNDPDVVADPPPGKTVLRDPQTGAPQVVDNAQTQAVKSMAPLLVGGGALALLALA